MKNKEQLAQVRQNILKEVKECLKQKKTIEASKCLSAAFKKVLGGELQDYETIISRFVKEDRDYKIFAQSVESFNGTNIKALEAYFLDPSVYGAVNIVLSKIIVGVIAFGSVSTVAASVIGGSVLIPIAGIASMYLFSRIMTTYMKDARDNQGYILDKSMIVAIEPFRLLLDKCAYIIGMQILSGKLEKVDEVVETVAAKMMELNPKHYLRKEEGEIQEGVKFCVSGQLIDAKAFVRANRKTKFDIKDLNRDRLHSITYLLENCPVNSVIKHLEGSNSFSDGEKKAAFVLSEMMQKECKKSDMQVVAPR